LSHSFITLAIALTLITTQAFAQTITGIVADSGTHQPMPMVTLALLVKVSVQYPVNLGNLA